MGNCSPSPRRRRPSPAGSPPSHSSAASGGASGGGGNTVSPYALARSPSVSVSVDPEAEREREGVVRVYGSDGCPVAWRLRVALLYKAAAPVHFTPSEAAPLGRPVLRLSAADPELCGAADELLRHVDARFEGKPASRRPTARRLRGPRWQPRRPRRWPRWCGSSTAAPSGTWRASPPSWRRW
ncbi:hypothetical protein ZWY2020_030822 [Hordeum vulgare]|nr:hypothetical protein ZWY2020_030822 [Hordeum vulgare]